MSNPAFLCMPSISACPENCGINTALLLLLSFFHERLSPPSMTSRLGCLKRKSSFSGFPSFGNHRPPYVYCFALTDLAFNTINVLETRTAAKNMSWVTSWWRPTKWFCGLGAIVLLAQLKPRPPQARRSSACWVSQPDSGCFCHFLHKRWSFAASI